MSSLSDWDIYECWTDWLICSTWANFKTDLDDLRHTGQAFNEYFHSANMEREARFTAELLERYRNNKKCLLPKEEYDQIIQELKAASENKGQKPHNSITCGRRWF